MNAFVNSITNKATTKLTENGDVAFTTSLDSNVDLFFQIAAIRGQGDARATTLFELAYKANPDIASRVALWARDVRGGAGERQVFRAILKWLEVNDTERLMRILPLVPEVGRWDDLFVFTTTPVKEAAYALIAKQLVSDNPGLVAKWLPRETGSKKKIARELMAFFELRAKDYRRMIVSLSDTVEQKMSAKLWEEINFSHVPSVAASRYSKAFRKHQPERYGEFIQKAVKGEEKINASALFPYDVTKRSVDSQTQDALWNALPDYVPEDVSFIPLIDLSGSMTNHSISNEVNAYDVAISIGMYLAEKNKTAFRNLALAFAQKPSWIRIPESNSVRTKLDAVRRGEVGYDTNLDKAFEAIVDMAVNNNVPQEDMPQFLIILSDMEFNSSEWRVDRSRGYGYNAKPAEGVDSASERTKKKFKDAGYKVPNIVWWNIASRGGTTPIRADATGAVLVGGCSPAVVKTVLTGEVNPLTAMLNTVNVERYNH